MFVDGSLDQQVGNRFQDNLVKLLLDRLTHSRARRRIERFSCERSGSRFSARPLCIRVPNVVRSLVQSRSEPAAPCDV